MRLKRVQLIQTEAISRLGLAQAFNSTVHRSALIPLLPALFALGACSGCPISGREPFLSASEAIVIASAYGQKRGEDLSRFGTPSASFGSTPGECSWSVHFVGHDSFVGNDVLVVVSDRERKAVALSPGH